MSDRTKRTSANAASFSKFPPGSVRFEKGSMRFIHSQVEHGKEISNWRKSVLKPYTPKQYQELKYRKRNAANMTQSDFVEFRGVSMYYLNQLYYDIKEGTKWPDVHLYVSKSRNETVMWERGDPSKTSKDGKKAIVRLTSAKPVDHEKEIRISDLIEKPRDDWTLDDIANYCIYPEIEASRHPPQAKEEVPSPEALGPSKQQVHGFKTYLDTIEESNKGEKYAGYYLVADAFCKFSALMKALKEYMGTQDVPPVDTFMFLNIFSSDLELIRTANTRGSPELTKLHANFMGTNLHNAIAGFDKRLIYIENWEDPGLFNHLSTVWETFGVMYSEDTKAEFTVISNVYHEIVEHVWANEGNNLFTKIGMLDPSSLVTRFKRERETIITLSQKFPKGFETVQETLSQGLSNWIAKDAEAQVSFFMDIRAEDTYIKLCRLLRLTGNFMNRREENQMALSYFRQALELYEHFGLEPYLEELSASHLTLMDDHERPREFTLKFVEDVLVGLIKVRLGLARALAKQTQVESAKNLLSSASDACLKLSNISQQAAFQAEIEFVRAEVFSIAEEHKKAIFAYKNADVHFSTAEGKKYKTIHLKHELGKQLFQEKEYDEALKFLKIAQKFHIDDLTAKEKPQDVLLADILTTIADVEAKKTPQNSKITEKYEKALTIVKTEIGNTNRRAGLLNYKMGNCLAKCKQYERALEKYSAAIKILSRAVGEYSFEVAKAYRFRGTCQNRLKKKELEIKDLRKALHLVKNLKNPTSFRQQALETATLSFNLGKTLLEEDEVKEGNDFLREALRIRNLEIGPNSTESRKVQDLIRKNAVKIANIPY